MAFKVKREPEITLGGESKGQGNPQTIWVQLHWSGWLGGLHPRLTEGESREKLTSTVSGKAAAGQPGFLPPRPPWVVKGGSAHICRGHKIRSEAIVGGPEAPAVLG